MVTSAARQMTLVVKGAPLPLRQIVQLHRPTLRAQPCRRAGGGAVLDAVPTLPWRLFYVLPFRLPGRWSGRQIPPGEPRLASSNRSPAAAASGAAGPADRRLAGDAVRIGQPLGC
jgi:hypothetical protein